VDIKRLEAGVSGNIDHSKFEELRTTSMAIASKMVADVDLYGKTGQSSQ
jgi:hypothetical protein